jgi:hypothetical protein
MDGDDFSRATRLGRAAADAIMNAATTGAPFDGFATAQLIARFVESSGGVPSLPAILSVLGDLASQPLLVSTRTDEALAQINNAAHGTECGMLDLQLGLVVQSAILRGQVDPRPILERFIQALIERNVIIGRSGLAETYGLQYAESARDLTAPIVRAAADELLRRPDAKRLLLARSFRIDEDSNLLGAA